MNTMTFSRKRSASSITSHELADLARLLVHANELYQMANSAAQPLAARQASLAHAYDLVNQVLSCTPDDASALNLLGRIELDHGRLDSAQELFQQCLRIAPDNAQYQTNAGYLHLLSGAPQAALAHFQQALAVDRRFTQAFVGIARSYQTLEQFDRAYLHYRSLIQYGHDDKSILQSMLQCCENIQVEQYQPELEQDLLTFFAYPGLSFDSVKRFAAQLISKKYGLENPEIAIDLAAVATDPLVCQSLMHCSLPDAHVEIFIAKLRQAILLEVVETGNLREDLQMLAVAIGCYSESGNYVLSINKWEADQVLTLNEILQQTLQQVWIIEDVAGALIVAGMYQSFLAQPFAVRLTALDLIDWPQGLRPLMECALYRRVEREAYKQQFPEKNEQLLICGEDSAAPYPRWTVCAQLTTQSLKQELVNHYALDTEDFPDRLLLLIACADATQSAVEFAQKFDDVDVIAVDHSLENLAEGHLKARQAKLDNIVFWPTSLAKRFLQDGHIIHFAVLSDAAMALDSELLELIQQNLCEAGLLTLHLEQAPDKATQDIQRLVDSESMPDTAANIRELRSALLADMTNDYWSTLLNKDYFYSVDGCRQTWFASNTRQTILDATRSLISTPDWTVAKITDQSGKAVSDTRLRNSWVDQAKTPLPDEAFCVYLIKN